MAYGERCIVCGYQESDHDAYHGRDRNGRPLYSKEHLEQEYGKKSPCKHFQSDVRHDPDCPVFATIYKKEVYCQDLEGKCQELIEKGTVD